MRLNISLTRIDDARWIAEVNELQGVHAMGESREQAVLNAEVAALQRVAETLHDALTTISFVVHGPAGVPAYLSSAPVLG